jgi:oligoendopeptidase F
MKTTVPERSTIARKHTWNAESLFATPAAWEDAVRAILAEIPGVSGLAGTAAGGPSALAGVLARIEDLGARVGKVNVYALFASNADSRDQASAAMADRAQGVAAQARAAVSFLPPELLAIGEETLRSWISREPRLSPYGHFLDNLFRKAPHVRSAEVEEILGMLGDAFSSAETTTTMLANADMGFAPAVGSDGTEVEVSQGTLPAVLAHPDRTMRRAAWESYMDAYVAHRNTFAASLAGSVKQNVFAARARRHASSLAAALFPEAIPEPVFHNVLERFRANLPVWHRWFSLRARVLGVPRLRHYDMWAPLSAGTVTVGFDEAVDLISNALAPLGAEYVDAARRGCTTERWVDVYPNKGKRSGAFSGGSPGTLPFIMMSYTDDVESLSTLAHELGHSMHSLLSWKTQPLVYADYSLFVAEVASNFHQALVRAHLLAHPRDRAFEIAVLSEAMSNYFRYFFIMPMLARFERAMHERVEEGEAVTADALVGLMSGILTECYGPTVEVDPSRDGMIWATFPHLFEDYYVYQYATGISGANALARRVLDGVPGAADAYRGFLMSGSSAYPLDVLRRAGVDLSSPGPVDEAFRVMEGYVARLEALLAQ